MPLLFSHQRLVPHASSEAQPASGAASVLVEPASPASGRDSRPASPASAPVVSAGDRFPAQECARAAAAASAINRAAPVRCTASVYRAAPGAASVACPWYTAAHAEED